MRLYVYIYIIYTHIHICVFMYLPLSMFFATVCVVQNVTSKHWADWAPTSAQDARLGLAQEPWQAPGIREPENLGLTHVCIYMYTDIYAYTYTYRYVYIYIYIHLHVWRSQPPPPWYGLVGVGGGAGVCGNGDRWSCHWMVGWCWGGGQGSHASPSQAVFPIT